MSEPQSIDELRARHARLSDLRAKADNELAKAEERLRVAQEQARRDYGTDDLDALRAKLREWREENETKRRDYQAALDAIEADLERVRQEHEGPA